MTDHPTDKHETPACGEASAHDKAERPAPKAAAADVHRLQQELQQAKDQCLRTLAEFENTKKRLHREKEEFVKYAAETVVRQLLPIVDSLDQALVAIDPSARPSTGSGLARPFNFAQGRVPSESRETRDSAPAGLRKPYDIEAILQGIQLIHRQLLGLLEKEGVKRIPTVGQSFDPHQHEAVARVDASDGVADETIVEEVQVGYTMHGKIIRPAMVKVAKKAATSDPSPTLGTGKQQATGTEHPNSTQDTGGLNG